MIGNFIQRQIDVIRITIKIIIIEQPNLNERTTDILRYVFVKVLS